MRAGVSVPRTRSDGPKCRQSNKAGANGPSARGPSARIPRLTFSAPEQLVCTDGSELLASKAEHGRPRVEDGASLQCAEPSS